MNQDLTLILHVILSLCGFVFILSSRDIRRMRTAAMTALSLMFLVEIALPRLGVNVRSGTELLAFIILGNLLASFFTPAYLGSRRTFTTILAFNSLAIGTQIFTGNLFLVIAVPVFFCILTLASWRLDGSHRLVGSYGLITSGLLASSLLAPSSGSEGSFLLELVGLVFLIGLFPFSPWFSRLYEKLPSGLLASAFVCQVALVMSLERQQSLPRDFYLVVLPVFALLSLLMALSQSNARRALSGLAASQLAFLIYADSGQHFSDLAALLLAQAQMATIPGLILTVGALEMRVGKLNLSRAMGHFESYPKLAAATLIFGLMGAGFPLSLAYIAEDLILETGFHDTPLLGVGWLLVTALTAITVVKLYLFLFHGGRGREPGLDILPSKLFAAVLTMVFLVFSTLVLPV
ncbi:MAG: hypothetical protein P1V29_01150 [Gammaproteobacteria bacterium]|jgi:hypothetical protein|nr:hypothetical protein [Gammaproteobacteria bacterium]